MGTPLSAKNLRNRVLEPVRQTLELPQLSWHTFRYTHATWLSESQVSARTAQSILGHADVSMTLNVYTQVVQESSESPSRRLPPFWTQTDSSLATNRAVRKTMVH